MLTVSILLTALRAVGPAVAAAKEFKALYDGAVETFSDKTDQDTLKHAYELAVNDAANAHQQLQDLVARHS